MMTGVQRFVYVCLILTIIFPLIALAETSEPPTDFSKYISDRWIRRGGGDLANYNKDFSKYISDRWIRRGESQKYALLIGVTDYSQSGLHSLDGPINDLTIVGETLVDQFQFKKENIVTLTNELATHSAIGIAFAKLIANTSPGDFVYIHYSGHGAQTKNLNADDEENMLDQTLVSYMSRATVSETDNASVPEPSGHIADLKKLDQYDILDDEINHWLNQLAKKTDHIIFVSDSCHSGSVTRGKDAPKIRAADVDPREYPQGKMKYDLSVNPNIIRIGACRDNEFAGEKKREDGRSYGLFSWYWVSALRQAHPGQTWNDVFKRVTALVNNAYNVQHPVLSGSSNRLVFNEQFTVPKATIPISKINNETQTASLPAGSIAGITKGSIFRAENNTGEIRITRVLATKSQGKIISGEFKIGDLVLESEHAYPFEPIQVYVSSDFPDTSDKELLSQVNTMVEDLPSYERVNDQQRCHMVFYLLHPKRENGVLVYDNADGMLSSSLPKSFANQPPELWVLDPNEVLIDKGFQISLKKPDTGFKTLKENLVKYAKIKELKNLNNRSYTPPIEIKVIPYTVVDKCSDKDTCIDLLGSVTHRVGQPLSVEQLADQKLNANDILNFAMTNHSGDNQDFYCYLINIGPDGKIKPITEKNIKLKSGETRYLFDMEKAEGDLLLLNSGSEFIKFICTQVPIDVAIFNQEKFKTKGGDNKRSGFNPLEKLIFKSLEGTRGETLSIGSDKTWGAMQVEVNVN